MKTLILQTVACHKVYSIMKDCGNKKIVNTYSTVQLHVLLGFGDLENLHISTLWRTFPFHFLLVKLLLGIQVSKICDYITVSLSQHVKVCRKNVS